MKKPVLIFLLVGLCFLISCKQGVPAMRVKVQSDRQSPLVVDINAAKPLPIDLQTPLPVKLETEGQSALLVSLDTENSELPIIINLPKEHLYLLVATGGFMTFIIVIICICAISIARSSRTACKIISSMKQRI